MTHSDDDSTYVDCTDDDLILPYPLITVEPGGIVKSLIAARRSTSSSRRTSPARTAPARPSGLHGS
jgi:hypothetical protein